MNKLHLILAISFFANIQVTSAQSFAPPAGQPGSTAISKDSSTIISWATTCEVVRGYRNIEDQSLGLASFGVAENAVGPAEAISTSTVSLGDGGTATLTFARPITNSEGADFVVFENGVNDDFLELGFVEVSSDGIRFVRFPAISEIQTTTQIGGFGSVDCRYIHNFAGKYKLGFGTPFDLEDLKDSTGIDLGAITHVRIVDVIGSINPNFATYDSQGNIVNNLHPTPFESSGFDLDAVGVIHEKELGIDESEQSISVYPNPTKNDISLYIDKAMDYQLTNLTGAVILNGTLLSGKNTLDLSNINSGVYLLQLENKKTVRVIKH